MPHGNNSPERRPRPAIVGHGREDLRGGAKGLMGPPRGLPPKMKDVFVPNTPTPVNYADMNERSASIVRHVDSDDVYDDSESLSFARSHQPQFKSSNYSRAPSELSNYPTPTSRPVSRFDYPAAPPPPMSRQTSNTSSVMTSNSTVSGSENWETYTDASDDYEPETDARAAYYAKIRTAKRGTPEDGYDSVIQSSGPGKKVKGYGLGIGGGGLRAVGPQRHGITEEGASVDGSEAGWTDVGETF